jgi:hypothetical protein
MFLKYNVHNLISDIREIIPVENGIKYDNNKVTVTTTVPHHLKERDKIRFSYTYNGLLFKDAMNYLDLNFNETYDVFNCDANHFSFNLNPEKSIILSRITYTDTEHIVKLSGALMNKFNNITSENEYKISIRYKNGDYNEEFILTLLKGNIFSLKTNSSNSILFYKESPIQEGETEEDRDKRDTFKKESIENDFYSSVHYVYIKQEYIDKKSCKIYNTLDCLNIPLTIMGEQQNGLFNENISQLYFNEKKAELIPEIIDYEKKCFNPVYIVNNKFKPLYNINFNLYFRDRGNDYQQWTSNDGLYWNLPHTDSTSTAINGDYLGKLGFKDDDVYYRKLKLQKTFLRLSFYDSKDPFTQMLLFYSTIFLDTGELYNAYIKNLKDKTNKNKVLVDTCNELTCSFKITDRFNQTKSSEGFYLYMFPDYIEDTGRTIYMRAEFNHAGYGKTIPLMSPFNLNDNTAIDFGNNFPSHLIDCDNQTGLTTYFDYLHIPVILNYDKNNKEYVYHFKTQSSDIQNSSFKIDNGNMVINLYEPKLNG